MKETLLKEVREELTKNAEEKYKVGSKNYFKEQINPLGVRSGTVRDIANSFFKSHLKDKNKDEVLSIVEYFLKNGQFFEEKLVGLVWIRKILKKLEREDLKILESYLYKYIENWAHCDDFCTGILGKILIKYIEEINLANKWVKDQNRWARRAAYVSLIPIAKSTDAGNHLNFILELSKNILKEKDDLVRKGSGWLLRELSKKFPNEVFHFIVENKKSLPRITLRNGIELLDKERQKIVLEK